MSDSKKAQNLKKAADEAYAEVNRLSDELDTTYAHLRALASGQLSPEGFRHAIVALLPETRELPRDVAERMYEKGLGGLADRHKEAVRLAWADYGFEGVR